MTKCPFEVGIDIIPPKPEKKVIEGWLNIYPSGNFGLFTSRKNADYEASRGIARVACVYRKIEYYVGEGLNNDESGFV